MDDATLAFGSMTGQHIKGVATTQSREQHTLVIGTSQDISVDIAHTYTKAGAANFILTAHHSSLQKLLAIEQRTKQLASAV
jgi:hypothetical protein